MWGTFWRPAARARLGARQRAWQRLASAPSQLHSAELATEWGSHRGKCMLAGPRPFSALGGSHPGYSQTPCTRFLLEAEGNTNSSKLSLRAQGLTGYWRRQPLPTGAPSLGPCGLPPLCPTEHKAIILHQDVSTVLPAVQRPLPLRFHLRF